MCVRVLCMCVCVCVCMRVGVYGYTVPVSGFDLTRGVAGV